MARAVFVWYPAAMPDLPEQGDEPNYAPPAGEEIPHGRYNGFVTYSDGLRLPIPHLLELKKIKHTGPGRYETIDDIALTVEDDDVNFSCGIGVNLLSGADFPEQTWHPITIDWRALRGLAVVNERQEPHAPVVTLVAPANGTFEGGTPITITGVYFQRASVGTTRVFIGAVEATSVVIVNDTTITAVTGVSGLTGARDVTVQNDNGVGTLPGAYTYTVPHVPVFP